MLGSFFAVQFVGNAAMTMLSFANCTDNVIMYKIILVPYGFFFYVVKIIVTNLLCHRYLLERAKIVNIRGNDDVKYDFAKKLRNLETLFKWEIRLLPLQIFGAVIGPFHSDLGFLFGAVGTLLVFVCDTLFSVTATYVFQQPLLQILAIARQRRQTSVVYQRLQKVASHAFVGTSVAVWSSTILCAYFTFYCDLILKTLPDSIVTLLPI
jgi:hypothetical protein